MVKTWEWSTVMGKEQPSIGYVSQLDNPKCSDIAILVGYDIYIYISIIYDKMNPIIIDMYIYNIYSL